MKELKKWLFDIKFLIEEINSFFDVHDRSYKTYEANIMFKRAAERNLEIIGQATSRILKTDENYSLKITNARALIGLRNQVIHSYDNISDENIWAMLINHLPKLEVETNKLLSK